MIILDKLVVKIIRLKIPAMQDLIHKKPNCQEAWQSSSKIGEFPNLGMNAKILRMQVWKWSILLQSLVCWPAPSGNEKKWTWKREWKRESGKYEKMKVKVMPTHSEFCMLACTSTFSHSSFVSFPSASLLTALGFFLTFYICNFLLHTWGTASWSRSSFFPLSSCCSSRTSSFCQAEFILAFDLSSKLSESFSIL